MSRLLRVIETAAEYFGMGWGERKLLMGFIETLKRPAEKHEAQLATVIRQFRETELPGIFDFILYGKGDGASPRS